MLTSEDASLDSIEGWVNRGRARGDERREGGGHRKKGESERKKEEEKKDVGKKLDWFQISSLCFYLFSLSLRFPSPWLRRKRRAAAAVAAEAAPPQLPLPLLLLPPPIGRATARPQQTLLRSKKESAPSTCSLPTATSWCRRAGPCASTPMVRGESAERGCVLWCTRIEEQRPLQGGGGRGKRGIWFFFLRLFPAGDQRTNENGD